MYFNCSPERPGTQGERPVALPRIKVILNLLMKIELIFIFKKGFMQIFTQFAQKIF